MVDNKVIDYFFKKAEIGEWDELDIHIIEKKFNIKNSYLKNKIPDKIFFLNYYNQEIDNIVLDSISKDDLSISKPEEIIQEYMMNKLEIMEKNKLGISNIINYYLNNPKFILLSLKSSKRTINSFIDFFTVSENSLKKKLLVKSLIVVWLLAYNKWLYEDEENNISFAIIDKGIKRIKKITSLFEEINKKQEFTLQE